MVWRLLRRNISVWQTAGYALANFVGLSIVLCALKFYCDVRSGEQGEDPYVTRDYIVISKKVSGIGGLLGADNGFSPDEISEIAGQPWSRRVGEFTSADFNVSASLDMGGRGMSTSLFLESVPDEFFEITPSGWSFDPESDNAVPIIISKDYLTLYNYGYAASAGVPQISEGVVGMVPIRLSVSGNGKQKWLKARVVGFSSRLNTIAVPDRFMDWANSQFGEGKPMNPGRLIIETVSPGNPKIEDFLKSHGYEAAGDKGASGKAAYFLSVSTAVVAGIGAVICLLFRSMSARIRHTDAECVASASEKPRQAAQPHAAGLYSRLCQPLLFHNCRCGQLCGACRRRAGDAVGVGSVAGAA